MILHPPGLFSNEGVAFLQLYLVDILPHQSRGVLLLTDKEHVVFLGDDEIESGRVSLKNMKTGEQLSLTREAAAEAVLGGIAESVGAAIIRA